MIGGFPCQGFSIANLGRSVDDSRNKLYKQMLRVIRVKKPKYFVAENVEGILTLGKGAVIQKILKDFKSIGYKVDYKLLNAADYGVPQARKRVFIIGNRLGLENPYPQQTHQIPSAKKDILFDSKLQNHVTTKEAINFLSKEYGELNTTISPRKGSLLLKDSFSTISRSFTFNPGSIEPEGIYLASAIK